MKMHWTDSASIAEALYDAHPHLNPLEVSFVQLVAMVRALPDFHEDRSPNERILEAIQMRWLDESDFT